MTAVATGTSTAEMRHGNSRANVRLPRINFCSQSLLTPCTRNQSITAGLAGAICSNVSSTLAMVVIVSSGNSRVRHESKMPAISHASGTS